MKTWVIDASVVAATLFEEEHTKEAERLLLADVALCAPDMIYTEVANVIWKRHGRSEISEDQAERLMADVLGLQLLITPCAELTPAALLVAVRTRRSVYDCLYLALALRVSAPFVTADRRLVNALAHGALQEMVVWIGDLKLP